MAEPGQKAHESHGESHALEEDKRRKGADERRPTETRITDTAIVLRVLGAPPKNLKSGTNFYIVLFNPICVKYCHSPRNIKETGRLIFPTKSVNPLGGLW